MAFQDNLLNVLRANNIFGGEARTSQAPVNPMLAQPTPQQPMPEMTAVPLSVEPKQEEPIVNMLERIFTPQTEYSDMYRRTLESMPVRQKPSFMGRLSGAMLGGVGQFDQAEKAKYGDYYRNLGDWDARIKAMQPGMSAEKAANTNERLIATSAVNEDIRRRDLRRKEEKDAADIKSRDYANQIRALVARGGEIEFDERTGKGYMVYKDGTKKEIDISQIPKMELEEFRANAAMKRAGVPRTVITSGTTQTTVNTPEETIDPSQQKVGSYLAAQKVYNEHPEWQKWINLSDPATNTFTVDPPRGSWFGLVDPTPTEIAERAKIIGAIAAEELKINKGKGPSVRTTQTDRQSVSQSGKGTVPNAANPAKPPAKTTTGAVTPELKAKATQFLTTNGLPVTEANIAHAIKTGRVK